MSRIHTVEWCAANPFDYPAEPRRHAGELAPDPSERMPWNYRETLGRAGSGVDSG